MGHQTDRNDISHFILEYCYTRTRIGHDGLQYTSNFLKKVIKNEYFHRHKREKLGLSVFKYRNIEEVDSLKVLALKRKTS